MVKELAHQPQEAYVEHRVLPLHQNRVTEDNLTEIQNLSPDTLINLRCPKKFGINISHETMNGIVTFGDADNVAHPIRIGKSRYLHPPELEKDVRHYLEIKEWTGQGKEMSLARIIKDARETLKQRREEDIRIALEKKAAEKEAVKAAKAAEPLPDLPTTRSQFDNHRDVWTTINGYLSDYFGRKVFLGGLRTSKLGSVLEEKGVSFSVFRRKDRKSSYWAVRKDNSRLPELLEDPEIRNLILAPSQKEAMKEIRKSVEKTFQEAQTFEERQKALRELKNGYFSPFYQTGILTRAKEVLGKKRFSSGENDAILELLKNLEIPARPTGKDIRIFSSDASKFIDFYPSAHAA